MEGSFPKPRCNSLSSPIKTSKPQAALFVRLMLLVLNISYPFQLQNSIVYCSCTLT